MRIRSQGAEGQETDGHNDTLGKILSRFEVRTDPFDEHEVSEAVRKARAKQDTSDLPLDWLAEAMAFGFSERPPTREEGWGTYFGPVFSEASKDGERDEWPSLDAVTPDMLDYWAVRARETHHAILRARYAGLVWDLTNQATGGSPAVEMARIRIDSVIEIAATDAHLYNTETIRKLRHAISLAISLNDQDRIETCRDAILSYEDKVAEDDKLGLWGFSYDVLWGNKKVELTDDQKAKIIGDLEDRLERVCGSSRTEAIDPWPAESAAIRLARHYRAVNRPEEVRRVLLKCEVAFAERADPANAMLARAWFEQLYRVFRDFGLGEDAQRLLRKIRELGPKAHDELRPISAETEIKKEEMDQYVEGMTEGDLETVLARIVGHYVPSRDKIETEIQDLASKSPLMFLFAAQLTDHKGRPTASIGPLEDDLDGHVIRHMAENMQFSSIFLRRVMIALAEKFGLTPEKLLGYVSQSPLFEDSKKAILAAGMRAYFAADSLGAIHLLIPQIEDGVRNLLEKTGGTVLRPNRSGGMNLKTLDELLRDERVSALFGEDVPLYLRVLLTDARGFNLRNNICHGISPAASLGMGMADRVLHALLILAQVRRKVGGQRNAPVA